MAHVSAPDTRRTPPVGLDLTPDGPNADAIRAAGWTVATARIPAATLPVTQDTIEAAAYVGVHPDTIRNLTREGRLPRLKIGTAVRYLTADLDAFIASVREERRSEGAS